MIRKRFKYYLKNADGEYYYLAGTGVLTSTGYVSTTVTPTPLASDPIGWRDTDLRWIRNAKYHGIFRQLTAPLSFVRDGASILRHICYTQEGYESFCTLQIDQLNATTQEYESFYTGAIDFSVMRDTLYTVQVEALDSGLAAILKAKEGTPYEHPIMDADAVRAHFDGISLLTTYNFATFGSGTQNVTVLMGFQMSDRSFNTYPNGQEGDYAAGITHDNTDMLMSQGAFAALSAEHNNRIYEAGSSQSVTITVNQTMTLQNGFNGGNHSGPVYLRVKVLKWISATSTAVQVPGNYVYPTPCAVGGTITVPISNFQTSTTMAAGDRLYVVYDVVTTSFVLPAQGSYGFTYVSTSDAIQVSVLHTVPDSIVKGYWFMQLLEKQVSEMTGGAYAVQSTLLTNPNLVLVDSKPARTFVTCGDALRGLTMNTTGSPADPTIKTTLEDLFRDAYTNWMAGLGVEKDSSGNDMLVLEHGSHFYVKSSLIAHVGTVTKTDFHFSKEHLYTLVKVGSPVQDYDKVNGRDEFNTTQTYAFPVLKPEPKELNLVSNYRDDMYGIEFTRANLSGKKTTDANSDNTVFVVEVADTATNVSATSTGQSGMAYPLSREQNSTGFGYATGLIGPARAFNLRRTPKRKLFRVGSMIHTSLFMQDSKTLTFQVTDKNPNVESRLSPAMGIVVENADVPVSTLAAPLFLPYIFEFETDVPVNLPALIEANPYGVIGFNYRGEDFYGFIDEVGIKPGSRDVYRWRLLASPDTDISKLRT